ncbi:hypothetical protein RNZ50_15375 [Paracoccaceae bacterium Fryx2]|nr:hypothetical protein [Paracoccaceae bacterium Fryx2]
MRPGLKAALAVTLVLSGALSGCGAVRESRLNPFNWFGRSQPEQTTTLVATAAEQDLRPLVEQVVAMSIEPMAGGAIVRATGLPPTQGWWEAELVPRPVEDGVLIYDFRLIPPLKPTPASTARSRQITAAAYLSDIKLDGIRQVTVQAAGNARSSRR